MQRRFFFSLLCRDLSSCASACVCFPSKLFKGKFYYCVGLDVKNITNKSDCLAANYRWVHHKYNFDNLGQVRDRIECMLGILAGLFSTYYPRSTHKQYRTQRHCTTLSILQMVLKLEKKRQFDSWMRKKKCKVPFAHNRRDGFQLATTSIVQQKEVENNRGRTHTADNAN